MILFGRPLRVLDPKKLLIDPDLSAIIFPYHLTSIRRSAHGEPPQIMPARLPMEHPCSMLSIITVLYPPTQKAPHSCVGMNALRASE